MIRNYLTLTFRNFLRNRNYTLINILGLSIGLTSCIILFLLIRFDTSVDKFQKHYDRLYRVVRTDQTASGKSYESVTPYPFGEAFRQDFSEVPLVTQFHFHSEGFLTIGADKHKIEHVLFADTAFFDVFSFGVISGNPKKELSQPNKAFLTQSLATKLGLTVGDQLKFNNKINLEVVGLVSDVPPNSHIEFNMIVSLPSFTKDFFGWPVDRWGLNSAGYSYIVLPPTLTAKQVESRFPAFVKKYYNAEEAARVEYLLQPFSEIHFDTRYSSTPGDLENVDQTYLYVLGTLGLFILLIACINFVNLATALAIKKSKEIGIRKTLGAVRSQLTAYFLCETLILTLLSVIISLGLVEWFLPWLRNFIEKDIHLGLLSDPSLLLFLVALVITSTFISGFYPAVILSGFDPVEVLKNKISAKGSSGASVRRMLVVCQFIIAQLMIIGTLVVSGQMNYLNSKSLGFNPNAVVNVPLPDNKEETLKNFRERLESNPAVKSVSFAVGAPTADSNIGTGFFLQESGPDEVHAVKIKTVDIHYLDTYQLEMKAGRWFTESEAKIAADTSVKDDRYTVIVNETAVAKFGLKSPAEALGKRVHLGLNDITPAIVGVVADFHEQSLRDEISPVVMIIYPELYYDAGIAITGQNMPETIAFIKKTWTELFPEDYFNYEFLDQHLESLYAAEQRQLVLFRIFSGISIFIGCLGLLGLVSFMANQKLKEIGVRKVFGASVTGILFIFSKEFIKLITMAFLVAAPLAWYFMNLWLQNFQYHISIHWSDYVLGLLFTVLIALGTVAYRSIRAGMSNPIDSLRAE
ncbi:MAG TPA: ABC transporter permease [Ohtaekwangia sp.]|nr:ABC transporter permease [Ohtaekwangia sp.]